MDKTEDADRCTEAVGSSDIEERGHTVWSASDRTKHFYNGLIDELRLVDIARLALDEASDGDPPSGSVVSRLHAALDLLNTLALSPPVAA